MGEPGGCQPCRKCRGCREGISLIRPCRVVEVQNGEPGEYGRGDRENVEKSFPFGGRGGSPLPPARIRPCRAPYGRGGSPLSPVLEFGRVEM